MQFPSTIRSSIKTFPAKLFLSFLLLFPFTDAIAQALIITETDNDQSAAISVTQAEPGKTVVCLSQAPNRTLSCYEATGKPMHLTNDESTQYLARKYVMQIGPNGKDAPSRQTAPDAGNGTTASPDAGDNRLGPILPAQETSAALRNG